MSGPSLAALVTITIPYDTYLGRADIAGEADGFGPLDGESPQQPVHRARLTCECDLSPRCKR